MWQIVAFEARQPPTRPPTDKRRTSKTGRFAGGSLMEPAGIEPATSCLQRVRGLLPFAAVCLQVGLDRRVSRSG